MPSNKPFGCHDLLCFDVLLISHKTHRLHSLNMYFSFKSISVNNNVGPQLFIKHFLSNRLANNTIPIRELTLKYPK